MRALEDVKNQVRGLTSRRYVEEAVAAYGAAAYRAALISIWIAVAADIIAKIRLLADEREAVAVKLRDELDKAIADQNVNALQAFERNLVERAHKDLELIGAREAVELGRLYSDRHLCAHPAFVAGGEELFDPTPELVRVHLATAVDALLSHPAVTGRKAIDRFGREIESESFPRDDDRLNDHLRASYMDHGTKALKANLIKVVCKESLKTDLPQPTLQRTVRAARELQKIAPHLFEEQAQVVLNAAQNGLTDDGLMALVGGLCRVPGTWEALHVGTRARVEEVLRTAKPLDLLHKHNMFYGALPLAPVDQMLLNRLPDLVRPGALKGLPGLADLATPGFAANTINMCLGPKADKRLFGSLLPLLKEASSYEDGASIIAFINGLAQCLNSNDLLLLLQVCSANPQISGSVLGNRQLGALQWRVGQGPEELAAWAKYKAGEMFE
ncbi:hypothetical protein OG906_43035 (plasmid) [Streptomyces sp. NBC_01426]|uniref:hypothetical protein n=1 Tax=Streptomyces sp. NBC_01426 TaxID=2975866 RepID=UPI002E356EAC|nr:hypothetical protein [Streptomyces sp. NBC_01426]